jgi:hypothetical protein
MARTKAFIDTWLEKFTSRKLLVWTTASVLAAYGFVTSGDWVIISAIYIGGQTVVDVVERLKKVS